MRKVRCDRAARAVPRRAGSGVSPSTTASSISSREMAPSSAAIARPGRSAGQARPAPAHRTGGPRPVRGSGAGGGADGPAGDVEGRRRRDGHCQLRRRPGVALYLVDAPDQVGSWASGGEEVRRVARGDGHPQAPARRQLGHGREDRDVLAGDLARHDRLLRCLRERMDRQQRRTRRRRPGPAGVDGAVSPSSAPDDSGTLSPDGETASTVAASSVSAGRGRIQGRVDRPGHDHRRADGAVV